MRKPLVAMSAAAAAALAAVALSACGSASSSSAPAPPATATAPATAAPASSAAAAPAPRTKNAAEVVHSVAVTLGGAKGEFSITPVPDTASPGKVTFHVRNDGSTTHEMVVVKTPKADGALAPAGASQADETGSVGETEDMSPGATKDLTVTLPAGHYVLLCNLPGHYMGGMHVGFTVR